MDSAVEEVLARSTRCVLAARADGGPLVVPMAHWHDGQALWMTTTAESAVAQALRAEPACAVYLPATAEAPPLVGQGVARVFGAHDPVGLLLHGPAITGAMSTLALRNAGTLLAGARELPRAASRILPQGRVVVRVLLADLMLVDSPAADPDVAPALPTAVPADVRRAVVGTREVGVATAHPQPQVRPARWGAQLALFPRDPSALPRGEQLAVLVTGAGSGDGGEQVGLVLHGEVDERGCLQPTRATWWRDLQVDAVELPTRPAAVQLPE